MGPSLWLPWERTTESLLVIALGLCPGTSFFLWLSSLIVQWNLVSRTSLILEGCSKYESSYPTRENLSGTTPFQHPPPQVIPCDNLSLCVSIVPFHLEVNTLKTRKTWNVNEHLTERKCIFKKFNNHSKQQQKQNKNKNTKK